MTEAPWEQRNNEYLAEALAWLRERLARAVPTPPPAVPRAAPAPPRELPAPSPPARRSFWARLCGARESEPDVRPAPSEEPVATAPPEPRPVPEPAPPARSPAEATEVWADEVGERPPAHLELAARLGLSTFERDVLLLAVGAELDADVAEMCARVGAGGPYPTFGVALRIFDDAAWDALAPHRPLRRLQLVTVEGDRGLVNAPLRADERVVNYMKGLDHLDERLVSLVAPLATGEGNVGATPSQLRVVDAALRRARAARNGPLVVNLVGSDSSSKRLVAERVSTEVGRYPLRVPVTNLPAPGRELDLVVRLWERDASLSPLALYFDASDDVGDVGAEARAAVDRVLSRARGLVFLDSREVWPTLDASAVVLDVPTPTTVEQRAAWADALDADPSVAEALAAHFDLDAVAIHHLAAEDVDDPRELWRAVLRSTRPRLDLLAQRVEPKATSDDLVVPDDVHDQLERIKDQVRFRATVHADWGLADRTSRGLGITALFAGESGTGKTLAAEVIAAELDLNLYRIDLSAVVSKYIGETEKNLRRLFDAAERGGTILFFDEADALFGKRSEVRDSHDRYANIEVNYLLQRMEAYRGLAVLATNQKGALDQAFTRRLRFVVDFPFPGPAERERIWRRAFLTAVRTDRLDFGHLAKLTLSGGSIQNVAVNATFAAAASPDRALTMPMVLAAARTEYRKIGLPVNEGEFRWDDRRDAAVPLSAGASGGLR